MKEENVTMVKIPVILSVKEAAKIMGCSERTVNRKCQIGELKCMPRAKGSKEKYRIYGDQFYSRPLEELYPTLANE